MEVCCAWKAQQAPTGAHNCSDGELPCATHCPEGQGATGVLPFRAGTLCLVARGLSPGETRSFCGRPARHAASAIHRSGPSCCAHLMASRGRWNWPQGVWGESLSKMALDSKEFLERRYPQLSFLCNLPAVFSQKDCKMTFWCTGGACQIRGPSDSGACKVSGHGLSEPVGKHNLHSAWIDVCIVTSRQVQQKVARKCQATMISKHRWSNTDVSCFVNLLCSDNHRKWAYVSRAAWNETGRAITSGAAASSFSRYLSQQRC